VKRKLSVCQPQQIIVGASRNFAVYTEELWWYRLGKLALVSPTGDQQFLKALALY